MLTKIDIFLAVYEGIFFYISTLTGIIDYTRKTNNEFLLP